jgi:hypothetical protein
MGAREGELALDESGRLYASVELANRVLFAEREELRTSITYYRAVIIAALVFLIVLRWS